MNDVCAECFHERVQHQALRDRRGRLLTWCGLGTCTCRGFVERSREVGTCIYCKHDLDRHGVDGRCYVWVSAGSRSQRHIQCPCDRHARTRYSTEPHGRCDDAVGCTESVSLEERCR